MTYKQKLTDLCTKHGIEIDRETNGRMTNIVLYAPDGMQFSGTETTLLCSPTYFNQTYELWGMMYSDLKGCLPLEPISEDNEYITK